MLNRVYIKGEISNCKYHSSGHIYFTLKDETGTIACVMFAGNRQGLRFRLEDGQKVVAFGSVNVYEKTGSYQLYAREIRLDGLGRLYEQYEQLKRELAEMGMFDASYKKPIPRYIRTLGVVTAPTGAAVRDIIQIAKRRNPGIRILLYPAQVQGAGSADSVIRGICALEKAGVDVMIIGRGGGSIEDLWTFNEESVARAVFSCSIPVISAVGHETDTVITDFVADLRAPTPSAAAELAVADMRQTLTLLRQYRDKMMDGMESRIGEMHAHLRISALSLRSYGPAGRLREYMLQLADKEDLLRRSMADRFRELRGELRLYEEKLRGLSAEEKLKQGYIFVTDSRGMRVSQAAQLHVNDGLRLYFADGTVHAHAEQITKKE